MPRFARFYIGLFHVGAIPSQAEESLFAAFRQREQVMSTGVGFGIAIPHVTSRFVTEQVIALGQSESGVDFSSLDGHPVSEIVLMISPHSPDAHPNT